MRDFTAFWVGGHAPSLPDQQDAGGDGPTGIGARKTCSSAIRQDLAKETAEVLGAERVD